MTTDDELLPFEAQWGQELLQTPPGPDCLSPDVLIDVAERGERSPQYSLCMDHVVTCSTCRQLLQETRVLHAVAPPRRTLLDTLLGGVRQFLVPASVGGLVVAGALYLAVLRPMLQRPTRVAQGDLPTDAERSALRQQLADAERRASEAEKRLATLPSPSPTGEPNLAAKTALEKATRDLNSVRAQLVAREQQIARLEQGKRNAVPSVLDQVASRLVASLPLPSLATLATLSGTTRGGDLPVPLTSPVASAVESLRPVLHWEPVPGAARYRVLLLDPAGEAAGGAGDEGTIVKGTSWQTTIPLKRGVVYTWSVSALGADPSAQDPLGSSDQAKFAVIDSAVAAKLATIRRQSGDQRLGVAVELVRVGVYDGAERELRVLLDNGPESPQVRTAAEALLVRIQNHQRAAHSQKP